MDPTRETRKGDPPPSDWLSRERILGLALVALTAIVFYVCYLLVRPFMPVLTWSIALAVVVHPVHQWIARRVRHPNLAAGLTVALVAVGIVVPLFFVAEQLLHELAGLVQAVQQGNILKGWRSALERQPTLAGIFDWIQARVDLQAGLEQAGKSLLAKVPVFVGGSVWITVQLLITFYTLYFFFRDQQAVLQVLRSLLPLADDEVDHFFVTVNDAIYATIYGTLLVRSLQGALGGLMFWILGIPAPVLWGIVMALMGLIPMLGSFVVWIPAVVYLALAGSWTKALILLVWGAVVVGLIDNLLYPVLVGRRLHLHALAVFFAVVGGVIEFGVSGVVFGPLVLAVAIAFVHIWRRRTARIATGRLSKPPDFQEPG